MQAQMETTIHRVDSDEVETVVQTITPDVTEEEIVFVYTVPGGGHSVRVNAQEYVIKLNTLLARARDARAAQAQAEAEAAAAEPAEAPPTEAPPTEAPPTDGSGG